MGRRVKRRFHADFDRVRRAELAAIRARWRKQWPDEPRPDETNLVGLALSGGGIRSASFSLGAVQQLARAGIFATAHYLSTVSGGGYTGSSLTWFLTRTLRAKAGKQRVDRPCYGSAAAQFPFLGGDPASVRLLSRGDIGQQGAKLEKQPGGRRIVDFIRQRSSYLLPSSGLGLISALAMVLRSILLSLLAFVLLFTLAWLIVLPLSALIGRLSGIEPAHLPEYLAILALVPLVWLLAQVIVYSLAAPLPRGRNKAYPLRRKFQQDAGDLLSSALALAAVSLWLYLATHWGAGESVLLGAEVPTRAPEVAVTATVGGVLAGLASRALADLKLGRILSVVRPLLPPVSLFLLLAGLGAIGYLAAEQLFGLYEYFEGVDPTLVTVLALLVFLVFSFFYLCYANINLTGLHRFYRDRLMETFMPDLDDIKQDKPNVETKADRALLCDMYKTCFQGPYQLINANVVMLDGDQARWRGRLGDSFVLAPLFCGSEATGWGRTAAWSCRSGKWIRPEGPLTLPTAMAISAAAVNPHTGSNGRGFTRSRIVSAMLTILNIRLGYWVSAPRMVKRRGGHWYPPNFIEPGIIRGIFGRGRTEKAEWLELTDGGHFDNTGVYELVRRGVRTIYFVDGTEDPETSFASFANLAEKIFIDFDVKLNFGDDALSFVKMIQEAKADGGALNKKFKLAEKGFAVADLIYPSDEPDAESGKLYYIKSTLTEKLPTALYSYKADHPAFPSESTADQFFDEQQFEAYRTLGFALAKQLSDHLGPDHGQAPAKPVTKQVGSERGKAGAVTG